jgi:hypothetical protein
MSSHSGTPSDVADAQAHGSLCCMQERNTARLSERLTLAEEAAALARADAGDAAATLATLAADASAARTSGGELQAQVVALHGRMAEVQALADAAKEQAQATAHRVAIAAAKDVRISRDQARSVYSSLIIPYAAANVLTPPAIALECLLASRITLACCGCNVRFASFSPEALRGVHCSC